MTLQNNQKSLIVATAFGSDGNPFPLTGLQVVWTLDHPELADLVVDEDAHTADFVPKPLSAGDVIVTGTVDPSGSNPFSATAPYTITLTPVSLAGVILTEGAAVLQ